MGAFGVDFTLNYVFPYLDTHTVDSLVDGPTGAVLRIVSVVFLAGALMFGVASWRVGRLPVPGLVQYMAGMTAVALRTVLPAPVAFAGLLVGARPASAGCRSPCGGPGARSSPDPPGRDRPPQRSARIAVSVAWTSKASPSSLGHPPSWRCVSPSRRRTAVITQSSAEIPTRRNAAPIQAQSAGDISGTRSVSNTWIWAASAVTEIWPIFAQKGGSVHARTALGRSLRVR